MYRQILFLISRNVSKNDSTGGIVRKTYIKKQ